MSDLFGFKQWQFQQNDNNFWRQATPALRETLNPSPTTRRNEAIARDHARDSVNETVFGCKAIARDGGAEGYQQYRDLVQRNGRKLETKYKVQIQLGPIPSLPELRGACARRAANKT